MPNRNNDWVAQIRRLQRIHGIEMSAVEEFIRLYASSCRMWKGKFDAYQEVVSADRYRLVPNTEQSKLWNQTRNMLIEGDNLHALKALRESHQNSIKLIYIDPPYNTGKKFLYRDRFTSKNDLHSAWLSMMFPRLLLAYDLLQEDGVILISINDQEMHHLRGMLDEIYGEENFVSTFVWETKRVAKGVPPKNLLMSNHEYVFWMDFGTKNVPKCDPKTIKKQAKKHVEI